MRRFGIFARGAVIAILGVVVWTGMVCGQETEDYELESITVTANKQEEDARDVPSSMTVFNEIDLEDKMVDTLSGIADFTPGLEIVSYGCAMKLAPAMRGIYVDSMTRSSSVGLYVDGIPVLDGTGFDEDLTDIARVEVLRGPQSTLYGKNAEVGVINIITKKPDNEFRGNVSAEGGEDNKRKLSFNISGPVAKNRFYIGLSGKHYEKDGFIENPETGETIDDRENNFGKVYLRWTPSDDLETNLIVSKVKYDNGANRMNVYGAKDREINTDLDAYDKPEVTLAALKIAYAINDKLLLDSVSTGRVYDEESANDFDYTNNTLFHVFTDSEHKQLSQELRLSYSSSIFNLLTGCYLDKYSTDIDKTRITFRGTSYVDQEEDGNSLGLFTHLTVMIGDQWNLIGGLRYDREERDFKDEIYAIDTDATWNEISPKIALRYQFDENLSFFANASKGYRAGGFNSWAPDGYPLSYDEETLWSYELGTKTIFWKDRISFDATFYYMDIDDMQVDTYLNAEDYFRANAAKATSIGVETQINAKVADALHLFAGFSYNDCTFDEYKDALGDYQDKHSTYTPQYDFNVGFQYRHANGFYAGATILGYGETYFNNTNTFSRDPYELVNARIGYEMNHVDFYLYGKNIFDKEYDSEGIYEYYTVYSPPRELGLKIVYRF